MRIRRSSTSAKKVRDEEADEAVGSLGDADLGVVAEARRLAAGVGCHAPITR